MLRSYPMTRSIKVPCCKNELQTVRDFVQEQLSSYALSDVTVSQLVLAVDEICSNLIIHSHNCDPNHSIELTIDVNAQDGITFEIRDRGKGFNFRTYQEPCIKEIIKTQRKGGVGLLLVRRIMDRLECDFNDQTQRNVYRLQKFVKVDPRSAAD